MKLFRRELSETRNGTIGWAIGVAGSILLYVPFYPNVGGAEMMDTYMQMFSPQLASLFGLDLMGSGAGYVQATYFGLMGYLLLAIAAISWGSRAVAGAEESGALELTLAHAVTRWQVIAELTLALLVRLALLSAIGFTLVLVMNGPASLDIAPGNLLAATVALFLVSSLIGFAAICGGALTGRVAVATGLGTVIAVAGYALHAVAQLAELRWLGDLSPYRWAFGADPITQGFDPGGTLLLLGSMVVLFAVGGVRFAQRDVSS